MGRTLPLSRVRSVPAERPMSQASRDAWRPRIMGESLPADMSYRTSVLVAWSRMGGAFSRRLRAVVTTSSSSATKSAGQSSGVKPTCRSTWWTSTSQSRASAILAAGCRCPAVHWTICRQASAGISEYSAANWSALARTSAISSVVLRSAPASIWAARAVRLGYSCAGSPVRAQFSSRVPPSALRARWVSTWPRVQPGSRDGRRMSSSLRPSVVVIRCSVAVVIRSRSTAGSKPDSRSGAMHS
ncbi:hypothetical protein SAMN04489713_12520 [Actinomadura madurae]|uniref:Uncharacterized protein n=1 Tax=Actinomadura madurae TaxID=1993 RepID=A0A1I5WXS6_9ACTN|nr:hypothetical protein SAMN04489713_12520 [Actinomadura madurae]